MKIRYQIKSYAKNTVGLNVLNIDGEKGWEVIFVISETSTQYKILLKRVIM